MIHEKATLTIGFGATQQCVSIRPFLVYKFCRSTVVGVSDMLCRTPNDYSSSIALALLGVVLHHSISHWVWPPQTLVVRLNPACILHEADDKLLALMKSLSFSPLLQVSGTPKLPKIKIYAGTLLSTLHLILARLTHRWTVDFIYIFETVRGEIYDAYRVQARKAHVSRTGRAEASTLRSDSAH